MIWNFFKVSVFLSACFLNQYSLAVSRHCTRSLWSEKLFSGEELLKVLLKEDIGMVIMKLSMQFGHLSTYVAQMMQVVSENWCQISYLGYYYYYFFYHFLMFEISDIQLSHTSFMDFPLRNLNCCRLVLGIHTLLFSIFLVWQLMFMLISQWILVAQRKSVSTWIHACLKNFFLSLWNF